MRSQAVCSDRFGEIEVAANEQCNGDVDVMMAVDSGFLWRRYVRRAQNGDE